MKSYNVGRTWSGWVPFGNSASYCAMGMRFNSSAPDNAWRNCRSISANNRGRSHVLKSFPGASAVAVRCMNRQRFSWKYRQYQSANRVSNTGRISLGALGNSACKRVINSSAERPATPPSNTIRRPKAFTASGYALSRNAP